MKATLVRPQKSNPPLLNILKYSMSTSAINDTTALMFLGKSKITEGILDLRDDDASQNDSSFRLEFLCLSVWVGNNSESSCYHSTPLPEFFIPAEQNPNFLKICCMCKKERHVAQLDCCKTFRTDLSSSLSSSWHGANILSSALFSRMNLP